MSTRPLRREENDLKRICEAVEQLQQGRSNAHGTFTLTDDGVATTTTVSAPTCSEFSHVNITPTTADAAALGVLRVVADNGSFVVHHATTVLTCSYTYSING
jgi:predicted phosphoribosyltransferase